MDERGRNDIRRLLKTFGVQADKTISAYLSQNPDLEKVQIRVTLEDLTDYGHSSAREPLHLEIEDEIRNQ